MAFRIRFLIDECVSPKLADLSRPNLVDIVHANHRGLRTKDDQVVTRWCVANDHALITNNARDFRRIYNGLEVHPGLVILLPSIKTVFIQGLLDKAIDHALALPDIVNTLIEIDAQGMISTTELPLPKLKS